MGARARHPAVRARMKGLQSHPTDPIPFPIQGTGRQDAVVRLRRRFHRRRDDRARPRRASRHLPHRHRRRSPSRRWPTWSPNTSAGRSRSFPGRPRGSTNRRCPDITQAEEARVSSRSSRSREGAAGRRPVVRRTRCRERHGAGHVIDMNESSRELNPRCRHRRQRRRRPLSGVRIGRPRVGAVPRVSAAGEPDARRSDTRPHEQPAYPAELLRCPTCQLVQLGLIVDPAILFPPSIRTPAARRGSCARTSPSSSTKSTRRPRARADELVVDVGSNDGTLLSNFHRRRSSASAASSRRDGASSRTSAASARS